jgi:hypothetical protein
VCVFVCSFVCFFVGRVSERVRERWLEKEREGLKFNPKDTHFLIVEADTSTVHSAILSVL